MEAECPLKSIRQLYKRVTNLDRHCRESRRKEERLRSKIEDKERKVKLKKEKMNKNWGSENSDEERSETTVEKTKR